MYQYWKSIHSQAWAKTRDILKVSRGNLIVTVLIAIIYLILVWTWIGEKVAAGELSLQICLTVAPVLAIPLIYIKQFLTIPPTMNAQASEQIAKLEHFLKPQFRLSFHPEAEGLARTPLRNWDRAGNLILNATAIYLRIRVEALSKTTIQGCNAFITRIEKESADGRSLREIPLPHGISLRNGAKFEVFPNVLCPTDFLRSRSDTGMIEVPEANWPFSLENELNETGTYHFTVTVNASGLSDSITVAVAWPGQWDKVTAKQL